MSMELNLPMDSVSESLVEKVYDDLLQRIVSGTLESGSILSEVAIAKEMKVSRTPVHDALRQLAKDGLVEQSRHQRARVAQFTRDDLYEIFELRKYLEGPAAELAAGRMDLRQLVPLREMAHVLETMPRHAGWIEKWTEFDENFHRTVAEASGNKRLAKDIIRYRVLHRGFNMVGISIEDLQSALGEHIEILEAIESRNGLKARQAMIDHITRWQHYFIRNFRSISGSGPAVSGN